MENPIILSIETSGSFGSIFLSQESQMLYAAQSFLNHSQASMMAPLVEKAFIATGIKTSDIQAIAISSGPGSYTGLRIGTSLAKGLCLALQLPLIAVSTLQNIAAQVDNCDKDHLVFSLLDARRNEVYGAIFDGDLNQVRAAEAMVLDDWKSTDFFPEKKLILSGDGAAKTMSHFQNPTHWSIEEGIFPNSKTLAKLALKRYKEQNFENLAGFEPFYLKPVFITQSEK